MKSCCTHVDILFDLKLPDDYNTTDEFDDYPHINRLFTLIKHFYHPTKVALPKCLNQFSIHYCPDCLHSPINNKDKSSMSRRFEPILAYHKTRIYLNSNYRVLFKFIN